MKTLTIEFYGHKKLGGLANREAYKEYAEMSEVLNNHTFKYWLISKGWVKGERRVFGWESEAPEERITKAGINNKDMYADISISLLEIKRDKIVLQTKVESKYSRIQEDISKYLIVSLLYREFVQQIIDRETTLEIREYERKGIAKEGILTLAALAAKGLEVPMVDFRIE